MPLKMMFGGHESPDLADGCFPRHALLKEAKKVAIPRRLWRLQPATQEVHGIPSTWCISLYGRPSNKECCGCGNRRSIHNPTNNPIHPVHLFRRNALDTISLPITLIHHHRFVIPCRISDPSDIRRTACIGMFWRILHIDAPRLQSFAVVLAQGAPLRPTCRNC